MNNPHPASTVAAKLMMAKRVLLLTHQRPDGDALGSTFGMREFLRGNGIAAEVLIPGPIPHRYEALCKDYLSRVFPGELAGFDLFCALDCANAARLGSGEEFSADDIRGRNFICIDHHGGNSLDADDSWIDDRCGSTCQMVMELISYLNQPINPDGATFLLTGMMTDTGCFCFSNTNGNVLRSAALAADYGADVEKIANHVFFSKPLKQLKFEADLVENALRIECSGQFAYACITGEMLAKYDFDLHEDEGLIDILRSLEGVTIAMLVHRRPDGWRVSLRSKDSNYPVRPVAVKFGGGGHAMAAGCTIDLPEFSDVEAVILPEIQKLLTVNIK
ncbi:MAG: DHH family phosphoesterase [Lentisphaeria bacterium]|nr:DHH family phosphoesterase [Lentisphaeria bacterium]